MPFLSFAVSGGPRRLAVQDGRRSLDFLELAADAEAVARRLVTLGVGGGDVVGLVGRLDATLLAALHGTWMAGAAVAPLDARWTSAEVSRALETLRPRLLLVGTSGPDAPGVPSESLPASVLAAAPETFALDSPGPSQLPALANVRIHVGPLPRISPAASAAQLLTSGTTGSPRAVSVTVGNLLASALASREHLGLSSSDRWLGSLSLAHVGGLALVTRAARLGSAIVLSGRFQAETLLTLAAGGGVTHASLVPTMLHRVVQELGNRASPSALGCLLIGGAPSDETLVEGALARDLPIALTYGLTEATSQVATAAPDLVRRKPGTVGPALPGVRLSVASGGEILVAGSTVCPGELEADGWLHTGDLGTLDEEGHLWITGRASDLIISGGVNVDPAEVERALRTHPAVHGVAVVGIPDPEWGEKVVVLVACGTAAPPSPGELAALARRTLSPAKRPREVRFVDQLPLNPNGKVDRERVRALFR